MTRLYIYVTIGVARAVDEYIEAIGNVNNRLELTHAKDAQEREADIQHRSYLSVLLTLGF